MQSIIIKSWDNFVFITSSNYIGRFIKLKASAANESLSLTFSSTLSCWSVCIGSGFNILESLQF